VQNLIDDIQETRAPTATKKQSHIPGESGIWVMIFGDMLVFSFMFVAFMYYRRADILLFEQSRAHLNQLFGLVNTFFMLTSSWFVAMAIDAARANRVRMTVAFFRLALACGIGFSVVKITEYAQKINAGIVINTNDFYMYYYVFTGIHFMHVLIGMSVLAFMAHYAAKGEFTPLKLSHFESGASFWHVVDLLWIALFALLYLLQ
jgi:nitric oxide reductase NorE protein